SISGSGASSSSTFGSLYRIMRREDNGTWTDLTTKPGMGDFLGGQGWYDNVLAVDPFDANRVYASGNYPFLESQDGGNSWTNINLDTDPFRPHDDRHAIGFDQGKLLVATDGGLW